MLNTRNIKEYIRALEHITSFLYKLLEEENKVYSGPQQERERVAELTELRMLAKSAEWPKAVPEDMICGDDADAKYARALGIVTDLEVSIEGQAFLDFGCGEGHVAQVVGEFMQPSISVGYDVKEQNWQQHKKDKAHFTTSLEEVAAKGPYDIILLNDVLDHARKPSEVLEAVRNLKKPGYGKIFMRCHPWTSRHGTHLYKQLNAAYLHVIFKPEEIQSLGVVEEFTQPFIHPQETYRKLIKDAGLTIAKEETTTYPLELFFIHHPPILRRIKERWSTSDHPEYRSGEKFPREILEVQFVDYVLL